MEKIFGEYLSKLELGELQTYKNFSVIPIFARLNGGTMYQTLREALDAGRLTITEIGTHGSVPELKVINTGDIPVLLLDGEELVGAKQNRVLNTTILIDARSETVIPVSCTEQGRWSYTSNHFADSEVVMASNVRRQKVRSVHYNLQNSSTFRSDQGEVWDSIHAMAAEAGVNSETGAMRDVFESREGELDAYIQAMNCMPGQKGMMAFINGRVIGLDCLSLESAYSVLHAKLVKSYALEAIFDKKKKTVTPSVEAARGFLGEIAQCNEKKYKSVGLGWDYRFEMPHKVGSGLEYDGHVIHTAFFHMDEADKIDPMAGYRRRRNYRTR